MSSYEVARIVKSENLQSVLPDFNNTEIAFKPKSDMDLRRGRALFRAFAYPLLVKNGPKLIALSLNLRLPVTPLIKATLFRQFCGGESIEDSAATFKELQRFNIGTILDYSVEGREREEDFEQTLSEVLRTIEAAANQPHMPFAVFKVTGLGRFALLAKANPEGAKLSRSEQVELAEVQARIYKICASAAARGVRIMLDAEESWIHDSVDRVALAMMREFNRHQPIVFSTVQMYRTDRLAALQALTATAKREHFYAGIKLVRGAYMEKERQYAAEHGLVSPIHSDKVATDDAYDKALSFILEHIDRLALCAGTHNEASCRLLAQRMHSLGIKSNDQRIHFSQLYGMSDNLTYNLAYHGYNASKYVPYGPVGAVLPYLFRRAEENSSIQGQAGRELQLIEHEIERRRSVAPS